ncbi:hypothetical protein [Herbaspirillum huttiense]|uniref:hypothetical protein n=1 Tax=Herbaspirillum huttiense TaxID=863372 RepID=UPI0039AEBE8A
MKRLIGLSCAVLLGISSGAHSAPDETLRQALVQEVLDQLFIELARNEGFIVLKNKGDNAAQLGTTYLVSQQEAACLDDLDVATRQGRPVQISRYYEFSDYSAKSTTLQWKQILVSNFLGTQAEAAIAARYQGTRADVSAALHTFKASRAQMMFAYREFQRLNTTREAKAALQKQGVSKAADLPEGEIGILIPYAQLIIQKFEADISSIDEKNMSFAAQFLRMFSLGLENDRSRTEIVKVRLPTNAVIGFRADKLFVPKTCSK